MPRFAGEGVLYWSVGDRHAAHFAASAVSLRDVWGGPVAAVVGDAASKDLAGKLPIDYVIDISDVWEELRKKHKRNLHYLVKTTLNKYTPFEKTIFIDLDTLIIGNIAEVFPKGIEIVLTAFSNWTTEWKTIRGRIKNFDPTAKMPPGPAINTGVFGWTSPSEELFNTWYATTEKRLIFMADELAMQVLYPQFSHRILDDRWNWSPKCSTANNDIRIAHGHGFKFHKTETGRRMWLPYYEKVKHLVPLSKKVNRIYEQVAKSS